MKNLLFLFGMVAAFSAFAQKKDLASQISDAADKLENKTIAWRRDFHEHPELGNRETRTAKIIADHLRSLGIEVKENVAKTGVVGLLKGAKPGPCVALRADIDALPIIEKTNLPFASKEKSQYDGNEVGVMHACGHDSHTAMLMTVAEILAGMKTDLKGSVKFIFQPAEEGPPPNEEGGAELMVKEGVLDNPKVDAIFGLHIKSEIPVGEIKYSIGPMMGSSDWFTINVKGKGSHGAQPWTSVDPVVISAQIITALQTIVSRSTDLTRNGAVVSVTVVNGGVRSNIIPEEVMMKGTIRTLEKETQTDIWNRVRKISTSIAEAYGATADVTLASKTLVTYNDPKLTARMLPTLQRVTGNKSSEMRPTMMAEDFSYFGDKVPSLFFWLGALPEGKTPQTAPGHHTAEFMINENAFKTGVKAFCNLVFDYLGK
ncbi:MAG TPA: amidohydrolase [Chitinophagaceae bacterium]|nr:amidohydrolase [Chitinophagaceae bacterium]